MFLGAFAPLAPALPSLGALVACLVALGLVLVAHEFVGALFATADKLIGWIPWLGSKAKGPLLAIEQRVNGAMSGIIVGLESAVASSWHTLARTITWAAQTTLALAQSYTRLYWYVTVKYPLSVIARQAARAGELARGRDAVTTRITRQVKVIERVIVRPTTGPIARAARVATRPLTLDVRAFQRWTRAHVKALEQSIAIALPGTIGALRGRDRQLGRSLEALRSRLKQIPLALGASAAAAAVAVALARLGASWIRCTKAGQAGRGVCAMDPDLLAALLAGTLAVVGTVSIRDLARGMQAVTGESTEAVRGFIRET